MKIVFECASEPLSKKFEMESFKHEIRFEIQNKNLDISTDFYLSVDDLRPFIGQLLRIQAELKKDQNG